jgi:hypothetical protein
MINGNSINLAKKNTATKKMSEEKTHVSLSLFTRAHDFSVRMC